MGTNHATGKETGVKLAHREYQSSISSLLSAETRAQQCRFEHLLRKMHFKSKLRQYGNCTGKQHTGLQERRGCEG